MNTNPIDQLTGLKVGPIEGSHNEPANPWEGPAIAGEKQQWQTWIENANRKVKERYAQKSVNFKYITANSDPNFPKPDMPKGWRVDFEASPWYVHNDVDLGIPEVQPDPVAGQGPMFKGNPVDLNHKYGRSPGPAGVWPKLVDWYGDLSKINHDQSPYEPSNYAAMGIPTTNGIHVYAGGQYQLCGWMTWVSRPPNETPRAIRGDERLWADLFSAGDV